MKLLWNIRFDDKEIILKLFDVRGVEIADFSLNEKVKSANNMALIECEISSISSGLYYLQVKLKDYVKSVQVLINR